MTYLLDTNTISELLKSAPSPAVLTWVRAHEEECAVSTLTLAELVFGAECLPDGKRRRLIERHLRFFLEDYRGRLLPFDDGAALSWGRYVAEQQAEGRSLAVMDSQIAAIALHWGLIVVTRNVRGFPSVPLFNPFNAGSGD